MSGSWARTAPDLSDCVPTAARFGSHNLANSMPAFGVLVAFPLTFGEL